VDLRAVCLVRAICIKFVDLVKKVDGGKSGSATGIYIKIFKVSQGRNYAADYFSISQSCYVGNNTAIFRAPDNIDFFSQTRYQFKLLCRGVALPSLPLSLCLSRSRVTVS
jgi:hypothetical protein